MYHTRITATPSPCSFASRKKVSQTTEPRSSMTRAVMMSNGESVVQPPSSWNTIPRVTLVSRWTQISTVAIRTTIIATLVMAMRCGRRTCVPHTSSPSGITSSVSTIKSFSLPFPSTIRFATTSTFYLILLPVWSETNIRCMTLTALTKLKPPPLLTAVAFTVVCRTLRQCLSVRRTILWTDTAISDIEKSLVPSWMSLLRVLVLVRVSPISVLLMSFPRCIVTIVVILIYVSTRMKTKIRIYQSTSSPFYTP